jgi:uncharacterized membrane protein
MDVKDGSSGRFFSVGKLADFFAFLTLCITFLPQVQVFLKSYFLFSWILVLLILIAIRMAFRYHWVKITIRGSLQRDLKILSYRLNDFRLDSPWVTQLKNIVREDKLPVTFFEDLLHFKDSLTQDRLTLENRKLRSASEKLTRSVAAYIELLDGEFDQSNLFISLPTATDTNGQSHNAFVRKQAHTLRIHLIEKYSQLINLVHKYGGDVHNEDKFGWY